MLGYVLNEVLNGDKKLTSPTDFVMDLHDATVMLEEYLGIWAESGQAQFERAARKLLPLVVELRTATADKYAVVHDD